MEAEEPALALDAVERRVPFDRLVHAGDGAHDERVEAAPDVAFPARHGRDVGLHGGVAVGLRDLRVAACESRARPSRPWRRTSRGLHRLDSLGSAIAFTRGCLRYATLQTGLALNCAGRLQSIRARTCSRFAKNCGHPCLAPW